MQAELRARGSDLLVKQRGTDSDANRAVDIAAKGKITQVGKGLLHLSIGSDDGLAQRSSLEVQRDGEFIGSVEIGFLDPNTSVARPSPGYKDTEFLVGDTVVLKHDDKDKFQQEVARAAIETVLKFMTLVSEQRYAEAAQLTKSDEKQAAQFQEIPDFSNSRLIEFISSGQDALAITSKFKTDRGESQIVFTLSGTVIEDIDMETARGVQQEKDRFNAGASAHHTHHFSTRKTAGDARQSPISSWWQHLGNVINHNDHSIYLPACLSHHDFVSLYHCCSLFVHPLCGSRHSC